MLLALDVYYRESEARVVGVFFNWEDKDPIKIVIENVNEVQDYIPASAEMLSVPT
jgi:deoxyribonuclease V